MRPIFIFSFIIAVFVVGCGSQPSVMDAPVIQASPDRSAFESVSSVTPLPTVFQTPTPNLLETAIAGTVASSFNATSAASTATQEMKATEAFWVGVTFAVGTQQATETKIAGTQTAQVSEEQTQTAIPPTITALSLTQRVEDAETDSKVASLWLWYVGTPVFVFAFLWILLSGVRVGIRQWEEGKKTEHKTRIAETRKPDEYGRMRLLTTDELEPGTKIINPNNSVDDVIDPANPNDLTNEQKLLNVSNRREADVMHSFAHSPVLSRLRNNQSRRSESKNSFGVKVTKPDVPALNRSVESFVAEWSMLKNWIPDGLLPIGANANGLMQLNPDSSDAHPIATGKTGSGKTTFFVRPFGAVTLASGWQVIICGDLLGYHSFQGHPNAYLFPYQTETNEKRIKRVIQYLRNANDELNRRKSVLFDMKSSLWMPEVGPRVMLLIDEFSNMCEDVPSYLKDELYEQGRRIVREGRKVGMHLTMTVHDVSKEYFDISIRRQMTPIAFRVNDESFSRNIIGNNGAVGLPDRHFITLLPDLQYGIGFAPTDDEISSFLNKYKVVKQPEPDWIDAVVTDVTDDGVGESVSSDVNEVVKSEQASTLGDAYKNATPEQKIRKSYLDALNRKDLNLSLSLIELDALGYRGGAAARKVKEVLAKFEKCEQHELADLLQKKVDEWKRDRDATTTATEPEKGDLTPDSLLVAG